MSATGHGPLRGPQTARDASVSAASGEGRSALLRHGDAAARRFRALVRDQSILDGNYHFHWLEHFLASGGMES